ncbi:MAG: hypothetical protein KAW12_12840 [Candidatus Aminicenantes bacterium]|nr:hypothetical protein [Candidatus Aminicenantes bacterium]
MNKLQNEIPGSRAKLYMYLYIIITCLLCFGATVFLPLDPGYKRLLEQPTKILLKTPMAALFFTFCFVMLFFLQFKLTETINKKKAVLILIIVGIIYFVSMPFFSSDIFLYTFKGKIQAELSLNPYEFVKYFDTPYQYLSPWVFVPLAYGPLTNLVFKTFYFQGLSPVANMYVLKAVFLLFYAGTVLMVYKYLQRENKPSTQRVHPMSRGAAKTIDDGESKTRSLLNKQSLNDETGKNFVFFALSPLLLIEGLLCAHLDVMPLFYFILSLIFLQSGASEIIKNVPPAAKNLFEKRFPDFQKLLLSRFAANVFFPLSFFCLGMAAAFKVNYAIFMLPFLIESMRKNKWHFLHGAFFVLPVAASMIFYPDINKYIGSIKYVASLTGVSCIKLFDKIKPLQYLFLVLIAAAFVYFLYLYLKKRIDVFRFSFIFFMIFLFFNKIFQPWHIFPIYGLLLFLKPRKFDYFGLLSMTGIYSVYFIFYQWNEMQNFIASVIILCAIGYTVISELIAVKKTAGRQSAR